MIEPGLVIRDFGHKLTTLFYSQCPKGFKFIGDDPENEVIKIPPEVIKYGLDIRGLTGDEPERPVNQYLHQFYLHNRCLVFTKGIWMSETAGIPHALVYKPGTHLSFKMEGMTRLTCLTDGGECMCVGPDPSDTTLGYYDRKVHKVDGKIELNPQSDKIDVIIATQYMRYGDKEIGPGTPFRVTKPDTLRLLKPGYVVEYWLADVDFYRTMHEYFEMWETDRITFMERRPK